MPSRLATHVVRCALLGLLLGPSLSAQEATPPPELKLLPVPEDEKQVQFRKIFASDGLPENTPLAIIQDHEGFMWVGTLNGLARFDGHEWKVYKHGDSDSTGLPDPAVGGLFEDSRGTLWAASGGRLSRLDRDTDRFTTIDPDPQLDSFIWDLFEDNRGMIWLANADLDRGVGSLTRLDPETGETTVFRHDPSDPSSLSKGPVTDIVQAEDGFLRVAVAGGGINQFDPATGRASHLRHDPADPASLPSDRIGALLLDGSTLWAGFGGGPDNDRVAAGLGRIDLETNTIRYFPLDPPAATNITRILLDHTGTLWVSTLEEGLYLFNRSTERFTVFRNDPLDENSLSRNGIWDIYEDRSGVLWVGTWNHGLNQLDLASSRFYRLKHNPQDPNSLGPGIVEGLFEDRDGTLWAPTDGGGVTRYNRKTGTYTRFRHDPANPYSLPSDRARTVYRDRQGTLWITTIDGLARLDERTGRFTTYRHSDTDSTSLGNDGVQTVLDDHLGNFWVATYGGGLNLLDRKTGRFTQYRHAADDSTSLTNDQVMALFEDSRGRLWVGTNGQPGLHLMDRERGTFRSSFPGYQGSSTTITESRDGVLWAGNFTGFYEIHPDSLTAIRYSEQDGLDSETVNAIVEDNEGFIWVSTDRGLSRLDRKTNTFRNFTADDVGHDVFFENRAGLLSASGPLFFGGAHGITFFYPDQLLSNPYPPDVLLTDFRVFSKSVLGGDRPELRAAFEGDRSVRLPHDQNHISFSFSAAHYSRPDRNLFSYKLEGYDQDWSEPSNQRSATYTNLAPGDYVFRVRAANPDGVWNEEGASVRLVIAPPWWKTAWAYALYALLLGLTVFGVDRVQRRRLIRQERERALVEQAELRAEAAEAQTRALEAENEAKRNVELLSEIGRQITGTLSVDEIIDTVYENVNALMDASVFGIGIAHEERGVLEFPATREKGERLPAYVNRLDDPDRLAVRCYNDREEIIIGDYASEYSRYISRTKAPVAGDDASSILYLPLVYKDRAIGVLTAQSFSKHAYSEVDVNLLRNLATYTAIALDNADAYLRLGKTLDNLKATQQQLVTQEKLASLGALTAGIAHEIKNPLNFVNNFAELNRELTEELRLAVEAGEKDVADLLGDLVENAAQISKHGRRADAIVRNMMSHAQGGSGLLQPVPLNELIEEYVDLAYHGRRAQAPEFSIAIERSLDPAVGEVGVIAQDLGRVLLNLIGNAFDALAEAARMSDGQNGFRPVLRVTSRRIDDEVEILVADNGPGIPEEVRERIFEPFFTTKPTGSGTGLGLSLSYDIITTGHGGALRLEASPNGGATFVISLPATRS